MSNEVWHAADLRDLEIDEASKDDDLVEFDTLHNSILSPSCLVLSTSLPILTLPFSEVKALEREFIEEFLLFDNFLARGSLDNDSSRRETFFSSLTDGLQQQHVISPSMKQSADAAKKVHDVKKSGSSSKSKGSAIEAIEEVLFVASETL
jgi:hypothetical protein